MIKTLRFRLSTILLLVILCSLLAAFLVKRDIAIKRHDRLVRRLHEMMIEELRHHISKPIQNDLVSCPWHDTRFFGNTRHVVEYQNSWPDEVDKDGNEYWQTYENDIDILIEAFLPWHSNKSEVVIFDHGNESNSMAIDWIAKLLEQEFGVKVEVSQQFDD